MAKKVGTGRKVKRKVKAGEELSSERKVAIPMPQALIEMRRVSTRAEDAGEEINFPLRYSLRQLLKKDPIKFTQRMEEMEVAHKQRLAEAKAAVAKGLDPAEVKADDPGLEDLPTEACLELIDELLGKYK